MNFNNLEHLSNKKILLCPLNWGLGHAARCVPIINELKKLNCEIILASDGIALDLLVKEFPELKYYKLYNYNIVYAKNKRWFNLKLISQAYKLFFVVLKEKRLVNQIIEKENIDVLISDNRFGAFSKKIHSIYITHQINVLAGVFTPITSFLHQKIIKKYTACWVPDFDAAQSDVTLAGKLSFSEKINALYLNPISRLKKISVDVDIDYLILLSGPEPQRGFLEDILFDAFKNMADKRIVFVKGIMETEQRQERNNRILVYNFATSTQIENLMNRTEVVICRSGYTTVMDLAVLNKKAFFIPTPGQLEQEYLANRLEFLKLAPFCNQENFKVEMLELVKKYKGLSC